jgi:site-specific recombinase
MTAIVIMVVALWMWTRAEALSELLATGLAAAPTHPQMELWAVRLAAVAAAMGAQWLLLSGVVSAFYDERPEDEVVRMVVGLLGSLAIAGALGLAVAGR